MIKKVSDYIADFFADRGVDTVFTVTGGGAMHLNDSFGHNSRLHCVYNHNEQGSAIAAEGYARVAGKLAVCCVTTGPGGTNALTGVMGGWLDSIPMFIVSGQVKRETTIWSCSDIGLRQLGDQEFDIIHSVGNMTKYCTMLTDASDIAYCLEKAYYLATTARPGPVWLDVPLDIQGAHIDTDNLRHFDEAEMPQTYKKVSADTASAVIEKIKAAKAPLIVAGTGITLSGAQEDFLRLADKLKIPVSPAWSANDTMSFYSPYYAGVASTMGSRGGNYAVQSCDLLISIGCRLNVRMVGYNRGEFAQNAYKIVVDIDEKELKKPTVIPNMPVNADAGDFIRALLNQKYEADGRHDEWLRRVRTINEKYPVMQEKFRGTAKLSPYAFFTGLFERLSPNDTIACANGSACVITFQSARVKQGQRLFGNSGCASMGYGLPAALGAAVAKKGERVVCIDGDGSIMMNLQELQTISYNKLNVKIFLVNNNGYLSIKQTQTNLFKPPLVGVGPESGVSFPNFKKLAEAFSIEYRAITSEKEMDLIPDILNMPGAVLCEVLVDEAQNFEPKLSSRVYPDGRIESAQYDDMFPFLPREEHEQNKAFLKMN